MKGSETKLIKYMEGADKRFVIPVYQRNYDWKIENCKQLYDDLVTPDDFIKLVLEWNEGSKYADNRVTGIDWYGEHNVRYGDTGLWMEFAEYPEQGVLAVRHEKITKDGVAWDSDLIMNYYERRIAVQLDRRRRR